MPRKSEPGIRPINDADGKVRGWRAIVDIGNGRQDRRQLRRTFKTLEEARRWRADTLTKRATGQVVVPSALTIDAILDTWMLGARHLKPSTRYGYEVHLRPVRERIGVTPIQKLTRRQVEEMVEHLLTTGGRQGTGRAPSTVRQSLVILEQAIDSAVDEGLVMRNVVRLVSKPRLRRLEMKVWTIAQLAAFLRAASETRYSALWRVAALGLRRSEVLGLRWIDVDFTRSEIRIQQTRVAVDGRLVATGEPKTASGRRTIPVDSATLADLNRFKRLQARERLAAGPAYADTDLVAVDELGTPLRPEAFADLFTRISAGAKLPRIRLHDLRHTAATLMHESGSVQLRTLAAVLGHADPAFTLRTYAHSSDEAMAAAITTLANLFEAGK